MFTRISSRSLSPALLSLLAAVEPRFSSLTHPRKFTHAQTAPCEWDLTHTAAMAELHSRVSLRHNEARRQTMGSQPLLHQHTHTMEDNIADGTYTVDDDTQGFFAKGREFESVGDAHT